MPFPISLNISLAFCVVFKLACVLCRRNGSSYAKEADIREKKAPKPNPEYVDNERRPNERMTSVKLTDPTSHDSFYRTGFHGHCCIAFPFFCLLKNFTVFISESWGQRFLSWGIYWHLVGVSLEPAIHDGMHPLGEQGLMTKIGDAKQSHTVGIVHPRVGPRFVRLRRSAFEVISGLHHTLSYSLLSSTSSNVSDRSSWKTLRPKRSDAGARGCWDSSWTDGWYFRESYTTLQVF